MKNYLPQWEQAKSEVRAILIDVAKKQATITYSELAEKITEIPLDGPRDQKLFTLLEDVTRPEVKENRGMLSAVVVRKGERTPGSGFFKLAGRLKLTNSDSLEFWVGELNKVHDYWSKAS